MIRQAVFAVVSSEGKETRNGAIQSYHSSRLEIHPCIQSTVSTIRKSDRLGPLFAPRIESSHEEPIHIALVVVKEAGSSVGDFAQLDIGKHHSIDFEGSKSMARGPSNANRQLLLAQEIPHHTNKERCFVSDVLLDRIVTRWIFITDLLEVVKT